ncbi:flagellar biosynthesis protein FlhB [Gorillibacterium timonense]|uniref:flagellar biosynthesis protein FlhB n=1 Tax=Gorillibacterium timonense TaxID=1689269 RepID=UPI00071DF6B1|nr:flagellar biosynthesis protein FlhB [Gorillibacterium timonense]
MSTFRYPINLQLFAGEKTEPATPKKRREAREKGQVAKSQELPGALVLLACFASFSLFGGFMKERYIKLFQSTFQDYLLTDITIPNVVSLFGNLAKEGLLLLTPVFMVGVLVALLANFMQVGVLFTGDPLKMKFSKINPIEGFKRMFGMKALVEFLKSILKMTIIGIVVYQTFWSERGQMLVLGHVPLREIVGYVADLTVGLGIKIGFILVVLGALDYFYQKFEYEKNLRMSKQDIKDEYKKTEGDPLIKGKIREKQRRMAMQRMMQEIPNADVIITNPTHFAVALKYDSNEMAAPRVIAKGADYVALKIKEKGKEHGIVLMENKPLARALYSQVEIGQAIPAELFQAVAEVLAYVYKLKGKAKA